MEPKAPAHVVWIYASEDESIARELLRLAAVLEATGLIQNRPVVDIERNQLLASSHLVRILDSADVAMFLCSQSLLEGPEAGGWSRALALAGERTRVVPVLLSSAKLPQKLASFQVLPGDGNPILARRDRDEALLEVIHGLQEIIKFRYYDVRYSTFNERPEEVLLRAAGALSNSFADGRLRVRDINVIFPLDGPPTVTFVEPPRFSELQLALRRMGTGLIVEGPSKVGKSTAVRKAMEAMGVPVGDQIWRSGQRFFPLDDLRRNVDDLITAKRDTWLFIDDFHHLEDERYRRELASGMKVLADQPQDGRHGKVTLIGINPLGSSLVQVMPDLSGRFRIIRLDVEKDWQRSTKIAELIIRGEQAANIRFKRRDEFVVAAAGSFFLAQCLCNMAAVKEGITETQPQLVEIDLGPVDVIAAVQGELAHQFRVPMLDFAAFDAVPPPRGAGLSLLWLLARSDDGSVSVREARLRLPMLNAAFDWLLESNLSRCFHEHPALRGLLYYNRATQTLAMENPQLKFYLRALDWEEFARTSGHGRVRFHPDDGPLFPITGTGNTTLDDVTASGTAIAGAAAGAADLRRILHLSDLHFSTQDQATIWYSQLAADLREQQADKLDALVVSGDLVNRADPLEYDAARLFIEKLMAGFSLSARQVVLVPGNHDVSWQLSEEAYQPYRRTRFSGTLVPGAYIEHDGGLIEVRNDDAYRRRFEPFADLYRAIKGTEYPLAYEEQGTIDDLADIGVCCLGLNSAWEIDHHFRDRASIHPEALANALLKLGAPSASQLRIAVFHHPVHSPEDSRIRDPSFLQQLAVHGFGLALHGHVHKADNALYRYDHSERGRRIELVGAGTFGAPVREWVPGYPLQYNLLLVRPDKITVETRRRAEINGAWEPDARWRQGPGQDPLPRYFIDR
jgi:predicted MPP superfamily phosphohydrolase